LRSVGCRPGQSMAEALRAGRSSNPGGRNIPAQGIGSRENLGIITNKRSQNSPTRYKRRSTLQGQVFSAIHVRFESMGLCLGSLRNFRAFRVSSPGGPSQSLAGSLPAGGGAEGDQGLGAGKFQPRQPESSCPQFSCPKDWRFVPKPQPRQFCRLTNSKRSRASSRPAGAEPRQAGLPGQANGGKGMKAGE